MGTERWGQTGTDRDGEVTQGPSKVPMGSLLWTLGPLWCSVPCPHLKEAREERAYPSLRWAGSPSERPPQAWFRAGTAEVSSIWTALRPGKLLAVTSAGPQQGQGTWTLLG